MKNADLPMLRLVLLVMLSGPLLWLVWAHWRGHLGVVPSETIIHHLGMTALVLLVFTLALGPVLRLLGWRGLRWARRYAGLGAFVYALFHVGSWMHYEMLWDPELMWLELQDLHYIYWGMAGFLLLLPLTLMSFSMSRRLTRVNRIPGLSLLIYPATLAGLTHYWLVLRSVDWVFMALAGAFTLLFLLRLYGLLRQWQGRT